MALTSFRLRRSDAVGSILQNDSSLDQSLRADGYVEPTEDSGLSTFSSVIQNVRAVTINDADRPSGQYIKYFTDVTLSWTLSSPLVSAPSTVQPVEVLVVINEYGEPVTVEDGITVFSCNSSTYVDTISHTIDSINPGNWVYYGFFIKYSDGSSSWYERSTSLYLQIPRQYDSLQDLWKRVPEYYRLLDQREGNNSLKTYLSLFGWELDKLRSLIDSLIAINDPLVAIPPALDLLAQQLGVPNTSDEIGTAKLRNVLLNIFELRRTKGTVKGITAYIAAISGCYSAYDTSTNVLKVYSQRTNLLSDPKFTQQSVTSYLGNPNLVPRTAFGLRYDGGGSVVRDTVSPDSLRTYNANSTPSVNLAAYTTVQAASTIANVGWGVYTYGPVFGASASVPLIEFVDFQGEAIDNSAVVVSNVAANGLRITIPNDVTGAQTVVVYGRKKFYYRNQNTYYSSFNCFVDDATFKNSRFIEHTKLTSSIEINPPDAFDSSLFYDTWNTSTAAENNLFMYGADTHYNTPLPNNATLGRFAIEHPISPDNNVEQEVVPVLVFTANPGAKIVISNWLFEPNTLGKYFDGDTIFGGFIQQANQSSAVGLSDYRWGPNGGDNNENFSYFTLDYGRVTSAVDRVLEEHLVPVTMVGTYTVQYNVIPGE